MTETAVPHFAVAAAATRLLDAMRGCARQVIHGGDCFGYLPSYSTERMS